MTLKEMENWKVIAINEIILCHFYTDLRIKV